MTEEKALPDLPKKLFWDTDFEKIDWNQNAPYIVLRVLQRGSWKDFKNTLEYYGKRKVKNIVTGARYLDKYTLSFCSTYFEVPTKNFRCYKLKQSSPSPWNS